MELLIQGGTVFDGTSREPLRNGVVAVEGGRVVAVGPAAEFPTSPAGAKVIDARDCTVLPGLIDTHVHVLSLPRRGGFTEAEAALWGTSCLQAALRAGVTTVRDMGGQFEAIFGLRKAIRAGWVVGPRLLTAGRALCITGGHGYDVFSVEADGPEGVTRAARQQIKAGADLVKLMATGGAGTPGVLPTSCQLSLEEMRAAVVVAHEAGKPAAAHAHANRGIKNALLAGVDSIEHGIFLDGEAIELMLRDDVVLSPTLSVYVRILEGGKAGIVPDHVVRNSIPLVEAHFESFRKAMEAGVGVVLGTDGGTRHHPIGDVVLEMELWVRAGMKPRAALESATRLAARACRIDQEVGTLEPGKQADLLIVEGDALADITAINRVRRVLRDGVTVYDAAADDQTTRLVGAPVLGPRPEIRN